MQPRSPGITTLRDLSLVAVNGALTKIRQRLDALDTASGPDLSAILNQIRMLQAATGQSFASQLAELERRVSVSLGKDGRLKNDVVGTEQIRDGGVTAPDLSIAIGGGNELLNSGFESIIPLQHWVVTGAVSVSAAQAHSGERSAMLTRSGGNTPIIRSSAVALRESEPIVFSCWVYLPTAMTVRIDMFDSSGVAIDGATADDTLLNQWQRLVVRAVSTSSAAVARVRIFANTGLDGTFYVDDVQFERGDVAKGYAPKVDEILPETVQSEALAPRSVIASKVATSNPSNIILNPDFRQGEDGLDGWMVVGSPTVVDVEDTGSSTDTRRYRVRTQGSSTSILMWGKDIDVVADEQFFLSCDAFNESATPASVGVRYEFRSVGGALISSGNLSAPSTNSWESPSSVISAPSGAKRLLIYSYTSAPGNITYFTNFRLRYASGSGGSLTGIGDAGRLWAAITPTTVPSLRAQAVGTLANDGGSVVFGSAAGGLASFFAGIKGLLFDGAGNTAGALSFATRNVASATNLTERMRIDEAGVSAFQGGFIAYDRGSSSNAAFLSMRSYADVADITAGRTGSGPVQQMRFLVAGSPRMILYTDGSAEFSGPIFPRDGVQFPSAQVLSSNPNAFDDYEEGNWVPSIEGSSTAGTITYIDRLGFYTKKGREVTVHFVVSGGSFTGTGFFTITGLPFVVRNGSASAVGPLAVGGISNFAGQLYAVAVGDPGRTRIIVQGANPAGAGSSIPVSGGTPTFFGSLTYYTT